MRQPVADLWDTLNKLQDCKDFQSAASLIELIKANLEQSSKQSQYNMTALEKLFSHPFFQKNQTVDFLIRAQKLILDWFTREKRPNLFNTPGVFNRLWSNKQFILIYFLLNNFMIANRSPSNPDYMLTKDTLSLRVCGQSYSDFEKDAADPYQLAVYGYICLWNLLYIKTHFECLHSNPIMALKFFTEAIEKEFDCRGEIEWILTKYNLKTLLNSRDNFVQKGKTFLRGTYLVENDIKNTYNKLTTLLSQSERKLSVPDYKFLTDDIKTEAGSLSSPPKLAVDLWDALEILRESKDKSNKQDLIEDIKYNLDSSHQEIRYEKTALQRLLTHPFFKEKDKDSLEVQVGILTWFAERYPIDSDPFKTSHLIGQLLSEKQFHFFYIILKNSIKGNLDNYVTVDLGRKLSDYTINYETLTKVQMSDKYECAVYGYLCLKKNILYVTDRDFEIHNNPTIALKFFTLASLYKLDCWLEIEWIIINYEFPLLYSNPEKFTDKAKEYFPELKQSLGTDTPAVKAHNQERENETLTETFHKLTTLLLYSEDENPHAFYLKAKLFYANTAKLVFPALRSKESSIRENLQKAADLDHKPAGKLLAETVRTDDLEDKQKSVWEWGPTLWGTNENSSTSGSSTAHARPIPGSSSSFSSNSSSSSSSSTSQPSV